MKDLRLPEPIAAYFAANSRNSGAVARCFTDEAVVRDEGRTHTGRAEIEAWNNAAAARYSHTAEPLEIEAADRELVVTSRVTGTFPGSPVDLRFIFMLERGRIASLEITP